MTPAEVDPSARAHEIEAELRRHPDPERAEAMRRYLKSDLEFILLPVPAVRTAARTPRQVPARDLAEALCQAGVRTSAGR